uniref:TEP1-F n=1 Tax=Phlebotomus papatasi TaxID=29031 RepID=A0A1B0D7P4_PHLPP
MGFFGSYQPFVSDLISRKVAKLDGKASVEFDIQEELKFKEDWQRDITVEAVVEEELTNRKQNTSKTVTLYRTRYEVELIKSSDRFKAGLPFTVRVKVAHRDGTPVTDKNNPVYIRQTNNFNDPSGFRSDTVNSTVYLDENGMAKINVAIPTNVSNIDMVATYLDTDGYLGYTPSVSSDSNTFLKTTINTPEPEVNREISVQVDSTEPMTHFTYQIIGRGDIIVSKTVEVPSRTSHTFKFLASFAMVPEAALVVYFVRPDGEIVSDRQPIKFRSSFQNFVKLELDKLQAGPGDDISLTVNTKPNSFVGLLGVDQSVLLLKSGNDLSKDEIFNDLRNYQQETWYPRNYPVFRRKRSFYPWSFASWRDFSIGNIEPGQYNLTAEGLSGIIFKNFTSIAANTKSFSGYIQTDKAVYKPGDKVRFRVVLLDANLKPVQVKNKMQIYIMDAKQNRIKQWLDAEPVKGVYSNELQLSDLPVLGDWTIQVNVMGQKFTKTVEVAEYVLPKFEVTIDTPKFATFKDGKLRFTVGTLGVHFVTSICITFVNLLALPKLHSGLQVYISLAPQQNTTEWRRMLTLCGKVTGNCDVIVVIAAVIIVGNSTGT